MRLIGWIVAGLFFLQTVVNTSARAEECLVLASDLEGNPAITKYSSLVIKLFQRANICVRLKSYPYKRMQDNIKRGAIDGEFFRVKSYVRAMSNYVVPLPTPVAKSYGYLVSLKKNGFKPDRVSDVKSRIIGVMHGHKWQDLLARRFKNTHKAFRFVDLVKLLKEGNVEAILIEEYALRGVVETGLLDQAELHVSKPVVDLSSYIVLHKKHARFVKRLDPELRKILAEYKQ